ncbi:MAG: hypothetical protein Q4G08_11105 [Capnocytophaga sp.]|nr:hypothetical protein [Capnocytophaga sp.]
MEVGGGMGPVAKITENEVEMNLVKFAPYTRAGLKYFYNLQKRIEKGKSIKHNHGNFVGFQNKFFYGSANPTGTTMLNEVHWGVQTELSGKFLFTFHVGVGHFYNIEEKYRVGRVTPTIGVRFKYILF